MKKIRLATIFSGVGAIEQAFLKTGIDHEIVFACDNGERSLEQPFEEILNDIKDLTSDEKIKYIDKLYLDTKKRNYVKESYMANYSPQEWYEDVRFLDGTKYKGQIDLLVGGSPCQSFSILGKRAGLEDTRGTLFFDFARIVKESQPKVFVFENVTGLLNHDGGNTWKIIREVFKSLNYVIKYKILNSIDFGIPQNRNRLFVVGFKNSYYNFKFPSSILLNTTMFDFLEREVNAVHYLGKKGFEFVTNDTGKHKNRAKINRPVIGTQVANQQFNWIGDFVFEEYKVVEKNKDIMKRAHVGYYDGKKGVVRQLSNRECFRLMGFSDDFKIVVPNSQAYRQAGNSIVVNILEAILNNIIQTGVFSEDSNKLKIATLFSGIGAVEFALKVLEVPHEIVFACDNGNREIEYDREIELNNIRNLHSIEEKKEYVDKLYAEKTRKKNYVQQSYLANYDVSNDRFFQDACLLDGNDFKNQVDIFVGGSPCQSFSTVGAQNGLEDARGTLFYEFARLIKETQPKVFIYENVRGLLTHDKGKTFRVIKDIFDQLGYAYHYQVLNSQDFGIPQNRRRIFVVGFREPTNFTFPNGVNLEYSMQDFLEENVSFGNLLYENQIIQIVQEQGIVNEKYFLSQKLLNYVMSTGTKNFYQEVRIDLPIARTILSTMGNRHRAGIDNYVTVNGRIRMLTEREAHRLMGFDDRYKIVVSRAQAYKQAGNSIVVPILMRIISAILEAKVL